MSCVILYIFVIWRAYWDLLYIKINADEDLTCLYFPFDNISVHPTEILPVVPDIKGYNISFHIQFKKVYPKPLCRAALGVSMFMLLLYALYRSVF